MNLNNNVICSDSIKPRRIKPQNLQIRLFERENGLYRRGCEQFSTRQFYHNIFPNLTVINIEKPAGFLRKFTPDGKYLIAFSYDQTSLEVYKFNGTPAAAELLRPWQEDVIPNENNGEAFKIRDAIFSKLFSLKHSISVSSLNKQLNRECSLFTKNSRSVIVSGAYQVPDELRPSYYELYTSNEDITSNTRCTLEDYTIYLVDLISGEVSDSIDFDSDKIFLPHNQGIYLYKNTFAVLSIFHQTIHIYEIYNDKFIPLQKIGRFCNTIERNIYHDTYPINRFKPFKEQSINSLKHRVLTFMFNRAKLKRTTDGDSFELRKFYQFFDQYKNLRMWKMQLIDEEHLLIKYASEDVVSLIVPEPNNHPAFFVFYNIADCKILQVYDNTSRDLLNLFENFSDMFRNAQVMSDSEQFPCSPSNNVYANLLQQKCKQTIISARGGGAIEATKRMLAQLPISAQSYSYSPYLDLNLFSYDDKWISVMERPKTCGEYPIRFFERESGIFKFRIYPGLQDKSVTNTRRLVAFTFHPSEPFAISVQRINSEYVVNFHIRNESTIVLK